MGPGDQLVVEDSEGRRFGATLAHAGKASCRISIGEELPPPEPERPSITLCPCLLKGDKLDLVARQAAEAGVETLIPLLAERSVARALPEARLARIRRIIVEARQQSGSAVRTRLEGLIALTALPPLGRGERGLFFHEAPSGLARLADALDPFPASARVVIGPEGGLSETERHWLVARGYREVWLGPRVLRAETAALFAVASIRALAPT
jgi:16S rRNA (uracil1498-N3)-methyltransferase